MANCFEAACHQSHSWLFGYLMTCHLQAACICSDQQAVNDPRLMLISFSAGLLGLKLGTQAQAQA